MEVAQVILFPAPDKASLHHRPHGWRQWRQDSPAKSSTFHAKDRKVCIVGGGPAGMMLGYLLGRAGIGTCVLEKHADFLRDFRGDTVHPSTLQIMHELGLLEEFLKLPHSEIRSFSAEIGERSFRIADFAHIPAVCRFIAFHAASGFPQFHCGQGANSRR